MPFSDCAPDGSFFAELYGKQVLENGQAGSVFGIWFDVKVMVSAAIDNLSLPVRTHAFKVVPVALMDVTVRKQTGLKPIKKIEKRSESPMSQIAVVAKLIGGGMGQQDIESSVLP